MAATTVLTAQLLSISGITGDLAAVLVDKAAASVADELRTIFRLRALGEVFDAGAITSFTLGGRSVATSIENLQAALRLVEALVSSGGRVGVSVGLEFSA